MDYLDLLQWPAMAVTVLAAWLVASERRQRRNLGFWTFIVSNAMWVAWGWHAHAWALIALQFCLCAMNIRGAYKAETPAPDADAADSPTTTATATATVAAHRGDSARNAEPKAAR